MRSKKIILISFCAALTGVLSQIAIPLYPVPVNLAMASTYIAGGLLGGKGGAKSQLVYVLLGMAGAPVFTGFTGGPGIVLGPTGGYIVGYIAAAYITGTVCEKYGRRLPVQWAAMTGGLAACYLLGTLWFMFITQSGFISSLTVCVIPFIPGDILKIAGSSFLVSWLYQVMSSLIAVDGGSGAV